MDYLSWKLYGAQYNRHPWRSLIVQIMLNNRITTMLPDSDIYDLDPKLAFSQIITFLSMTNRTIYLNPLYVYFANFLKSLYMLNIYIFLWQHFVEPSTGLQFTPFIHYITNWWCPQCGIALVGHSIVCLTSIYGYWLLRTFHLLWTFIYMCV